MVVVLGGREGYAEGYPTTQQYIQHTAYNIIEVTAVIRKPSKSTISEHTGPHFYFSIPSTPLQTVLLKYQRRASSPDSHAQTITKHQVSSLVPRKLQGETCEYSSIEILQ